MSVHSNSEWDFPRLVGVIHLMPLPGSPGAGAGFPAETIAQVCERAFEECKILESAGFEGIILENFGDVPFYKSCVPPETIASMTLVAGILRQETHLPLGINVLRNDARAALSIAATTGCNFIRVNVLSGVAATDQGLIEGDSAFLLRERMRLGAQSVRIFADVHVKHAKSLSSKSVVLGAEEVLGRGGADAVIATGATTGRPVSMVKLKKMKAAATEHGAPVYVGSGASLSNLAQLKTFADGIIVGSSLRKDSKPGAPLELARAKSFAKGFLKEFGSR